MKQDQAQSISGLKFSEGKSFSADGSNNNNKEENNRGKRTRTMIILLSAITLIIVIIALILGLTLKKRSKKYTRFTSRTDTYIVNPSHIDGIAGEEYYVELETNKNCLAPEKLSFFNSYGLNKSQLIINVEPNNQTKCSYNISLLQYKSTNKSEYNILTIKYGNKTINESISLNIKNAAFDKLEYISGPTEGNVLDPPNITFIPLDKYGNLYSDIFQNDQRRNLKETDKERQKFLEELTKGNLGNNSLESNAYLLDERFIKIQYKSTKKGNITMTSPYFKGKFEYRIKSGPIDLNTSYVEIIDYTDSNLKYIIYPKDVYGNEIDDLNISFLQHLINAKDNINNKCSLKNDTIFECDLPLSQDEDINNLKFFYENRFRCINCNITKKKDAKIETTDIKIETTNIAFPEIDENNFKVSYVNFNGQTIPAGENITFIVQAYDKNNNKINHISLTSELFKIEIKSEITDYFFNQDSSNPGMIKCIFNSEKIGSFKFNYYYKDKLITIKNNKGPDNITYIAGACNKDNSEIISQESENIMGNENNITIKCFDKYKNVIKKGGENFSANIKVDYTDELKSTIIDNKDGSYTLKYTKSLFGIYSIIILLDEKNFNKITLNLTDLNCKEEGYVKCPYGYKICYYDDIIACIPSEIKCDKKEESYEKPFKCKNTNECVESLTECEPEEGYKKCFYMGFQYPQDKEYLCSNYTGISCQEGQVLCDDGICRDEKNNPTQIVCPVGTVLCPDLTCRNSLSQCKTDYPECGKDQYRCRDQSCVDDIKKCPSTLTCSHSQMVCPDGTCVDSVLNCGRLKTCPESEPFLCLDYSCAKNAESCTHFPACEDGKFLCSDTLECSASCGGSGGIK